MARVPTAEQGTYPDILLFREGEWYYFSLYTWTVLESNMLPSHLVWRRVRAGSHLLSTFKVPVPRAIGATQCVMGGIYKLALLQSPCGLRSWFSMPTCSSPQLKQANSCENGRFCSCPLKYDGGCFGYEDSPSSYHTSLLFWRGRAKWHMNIQSLYVEQPERFVRTVSTAHWKQNV